MPNQPQKKQTQRTKGNVRPSSSSQAASLLHSSKISSKVSSTMGFVGFGGATHPVFVAAGESLEDENSCLEPNFRMTLRKLSKKDPTTKIKTLQEFSILCSESEEAAITSVLPYWPRIYNRVSTDDDHKVREASQHATSALVCRAGRSFAPHLRSIMGHWLMAQCDPYPTVSSAALAAFRAAFPPHKQAGVMAFCRDDIENLLLHNLINQSPVTLAENRPASSDEIQARYARLLVTSLVAWKRLLAATTTDGSRTVEVVETGQLAKILKIDQSNVRAAVFSFISSVCQRDLITSDVSRKNLVPLVMNRIDERDVVVCPCLWEAVLSVVNHVADWQTFVNIPKSWRPKLRSVLREGCHGNASIIGPSLLPLVGHIPADIEGGQAAIQRDIVLSLHEGLMLTTGQSETSALVAAYIECVQYLTRLHGNHAQFGGVIHDQLLTLISESLTQKSPVLSKSPLYSMLNKLLPSNNKSESPLSCDSVSAVLIDAINTIGDCDSERVPGRICKLVRNLLWPEQNKRQKSEKVKFSLDKTDSNSKSVCGKYDKSDVLMSDAISSILIGLYRLIFENARLVSECNNRHISFFRDLVLMFYDGSILSRILSDSSLLTETTESSHNSGRIVETFISEICLPWLSELSDSCQSLDDTDCLLDIVFSMLVDCNVTSAVTILDKIAEITTNSSKLLHKTLSWSTSSDLIVDWLRGEVMTRRLVEITSTFCHELVSGHSGPFHNDWSALTNCLALTHHGESLLLPETVNKMLNEIQNCVEDLQASQSEVKLEQAVRFVTSVMDKFLCGIQGCTLSSGAESLLTSLFALSLADSLPITDLSRQSIEQAWVNGLTAMSHDRLALLADGGFVRSSIRLLGESAMTVNSPQRFVLLASITTKFLSTLRQNLPESTSRTTLHEVASLLWRPLSTAKPPREVCEVIYWKIPLQKTDCFAPVTENFQSVVRLTYVCMYNALLLSDVVLGNKSSATFDWCKSSEVIERSNVTGSSKVTEVSPSMVNENTEKLRSNVEGNLEQRSKEVESTNESNLTVDETKEELTSNLDESLNDESEVTEFSECSKGNDNYPAIRIAKDFESAWSVATDDDAGSQVIHSLKMDDDKKETCVDRMLYDANLRSEVTDMAADLLYAYVLIRTWTEVDIKAGLGVEDEVATLRRDVIRVLTTLTQNDLLLFTDLITKRSLENGHFWAVSLMELLHGQVTHLSTASQDLFTLRHGALTDGLLHSLQIIAPFLNVTNRGRLLLEISDAVLVVSVEHLKTESGQRETAGYLGILASILACDCGSLDLFTRVLDHLIGWSKICEEIWLFNVDLSESAESVVRLNSAVVTYLSAIVSRAPSDFNLLSTQWDFILCSAVSWLQSVDDCYTIITSEVNVQRLCAQCCHLLAEVDNCIKVRLPQGDLFIEWSDFFCTTAFDVLLPLFVRLATEETGHLTVQYMMRHLTDLLHHCPKERILVAPIQPYLIADLTTTLPDNLQTLLNRLCPLLRSRSACVQGAAFVLLDRIMDDVAQFDSSDRQSEVDTGNYTDSRSPPEPIMSVLHRAAAQLETVNSEPYNKDQPPPFSESFYDTSAFLFSWNLLITFFNASSSELRCLHAAYLSSHGVLSTLSHTLQLIPDNDSSPHTLTLSMFQTTDQTAYNRGVHCSNALIQLACSTYRRAVEVMPALVRQWWLGLDRNTAAYVDKFTTWYVTPPLSRAQLTTVNAAQQIDNLTVKARVSTGEVIATYELEEVTMEMVVILPSNYPLGQMRVISEKRVGVKAGQWQKWLLQLNIFLQHQNGSIMEGLRLWKRNIDKRFDGVDDCMICFSVIHTTTCQLPRLECHTCHKKFHSACLYKWFNTSHNPTCPLCRNLF